MKRIVQLSLGVLLLVALLAALVNLLAEPPGTLPAVDPAMIITMPDGAQRPLGELAAASARSGEAVPIAPAVDDPGPAHGAGATEGRERPATGDGALVAVVDLEGRRSEPPDGRDLYELAEYERSQGRVEQALALLRSVPEDHPRYARAQRAIGWDLYTEELGEPRRGIAFVNRSVRADPLDGNAWQDLARVYARGLGLPVD